MAENTKRRSVSACAEEPVRRTCTLKDRQTEKKCLVQGQNLRSGEYACPSVTVICRKEEFGKNVLKLVARKYGA